MRQCTLILVYLCFYSIAQAQTTKGTEFWLGYLENIDLLFNGDPSFTIEVTAEVTTEGSINVPTTGLSIPFTATGGTTTEVQFPQAIWYSEGSDDIDNKGIQILTDNPVSLIGVHYRVFFSDATQVLPTTELGTLYYPTCYGTDGFASASEFNIVATADNTEIEITPSTLTLGLYPAGIPYTITLNAGQNYQVQASLDLTGSKVESLSGQPIAVFSGMRDGEVACGYTSHAYDQSFPVDLWAEHYYYVPFKDRVNDQVVIVAQADNTTVFLDCEQVATLNTGENYQTSIDEAVIINASAPISVAQFVSGASCNNELGDPNMLQLNPTNRQGYGGTFFASDENMGGGDPNFSKHCFNIVTRTENIAAITLDGSNIVSQFSAFSANPDFSYAQVDITAGVHELVSSELFHAYQYSTGLADAYTASLGYEALADVAFSCLAIQSEGVNCVDSTITFTAFTNFDINEYNWDLGNMTTSNEAAPTTTYSAAGEYQVTLEAITSTGNSYFDTLTINIVDCDPDPCANIPDIQITQMGELCVDELISFDITPQVDFASLAWQFGNGEGALSLPATTSYDAVDTYVVNFIGFDANDCQYIANAQLEIEDCNNPCDNPPPASIVTDGVTCLDSLVTVNVISDATFIVYDWSTTDGQLSQEASPTFSLNQLGEFEIMLISTFDNLCDYIDTISINVEDCQIAPCDELPDVTIEPTGDFCVDSLVAFSANTTAILESYSWVTSNGQVSTAPNPELTFPIGNYTIDLTAFDENGCLISTNEAFDINNCSEPSTCELYIPNAFSPNIDGLNDDFGAIGDCPVTDFELRVYNRWGGLVFETNDPMAKWDGNLNNQPAPMGVYVWLVSYNVTNGGRVKAQGDVTLLR